jgi:hypothetical protein
MTRDVTSLFAGKSNKGNIAGLSVSEVRTPAKRSLFRVEDKSSLIETRLEAVKGSGKVKYSKEGGNIIRYEYSKGTSKLIRADVYDSKGNWIKSNIKAPGGVSESLRVSKLYGEEGLLQGDLSTGRINVKTTKIFKDIAGKGFSGKESPSFFEYKDTPIKKIKVHTPYPTDEGLLTIQKMSPPKAIPKVPTPQATLVSASKTTLINLPAPTPTYVGGEGGLLSQSIYSGKGSFVGEQVTAKFIQIPLTKTDSSISSMSMLSPQAEQVYLEPQTKQLFVDTQAIQLFAEAKTKKAFTKPVPIAEQLFIQPQAIQLFAEPQAITKQVSKLQTLQITQLNLLSPKIDPIITTPSIGIPGTIPIFGLPGLGSPKTGGGQRGTKQRTKSSFLPKYNPSLGAVLTGKKAKEVTQKQYNLLSKKKYFGFESRGLLKIVSKKKKPKKKK